MDRCEIAYNAPLHQQASSGNVHGTDVPGRMVLFQYREALDCPLALNPVDDYGGPKALPAPDGPMDLVLKCTVSPRGQRDDIGKVSSSMRYIVRSFQCVSSTSVMRSKEAHEHTSSLDFTGTAVPQRLHTPASRVMRQDSWWRSCLVNDRADGCFSLYQLPPRGRTILQAMQAGMIDYASLRASRVKDEHFDTASCQSERHELSRIV
jgi:hypothetical protein